jgi:hypothetical protein
MQVKKFVDNHNFAKGAVFSQQIGAQADPTGERTGSPFRCHPLDLNTLGMNSDF